MLHLESHESTVGPTAVALIQTPTPTDPDRNQVLQLESREPEWDPSAGAHSLNFHGRVSMASVKNFQLELVGEAADGLGTPSDHEEHRAGGVPGEAPSTRPSAKALIMQFGKQDKDVFALDFRHPLSPVQAFALGLTALARKLASEGG